MRNPYQILGVSENADMDEIKKAYRKLSRIYHPDANVNNPNKDQAEAKFKEIQAAYQQIVTERERGSSSSYSNGGSYGQGTYQQGPFGGFGGYTQQRQESQESTRIQAAGNYIRNGYYKEALNVLESMASSERNAKWYYYSAMANSGLGNNITAREHAQKAVQLEPSNYQYQALLQRLQSGESWYTERGTMYGRPVMSMGNCCMEYLALQCFCNLCCC